MLPGYNPDVGTTLSIPHGAVVVTVKLLTAFQIGKWSPDGSVALCNQNHVNYCPGSLHIAPIDDYGDYSIGRWVWVLRQVDVLNPPVAASGHQGFWDWNQEGSSGNREV